MTFFLRPRKWRLPCGVEFADIAGVQPGFVGGGLHCAGLPVARGDIFAADENFAVFGELEFAAGQDFADGALRRAKRMIEADQRSGFGHAVALDDGVADALEEFFRGGGERGAAGDEGPEFPAEAAVNAAEEPGAAEEFPTVGGSERTIERISQSA